MLEKVLIIVKQEKSMPKGCRIYLDQMIQRYVAKMLSKEGHDVVRALDF